MGRAWFSSFSIAGKKSIMVHRFRTSWLCCLCYADPPIGCFHIIGSVPDAATICSFFQVSKCPWLLKLRVQASEIGDDGGGYVFDSERRLAISGRDTCRAPCCTVWHPTHSPNCEWPLFSAARDHRCHDNAV